MANDAKYIIQGICLRDRAKNHNYDPQKIYSKIKLREQQKTKKTENREAFVILIHNQEPHKLQRSKEKIEARENKPVYKKGTKTMQEAKAMQRLLAWTHPPQEVLDEINKPLKPMKDKKKLRKISCNQAKN